MTRLKLILFLVVAALAPATALAASGAAPTLPGRWTRLPAAPISPDWGSAASVWTGKRLLVFGRDQRTAKAADGSLYSIGSVNVAASYDPANHRWRKLSPPAGPANSPSVATAWTGKEMLVWGSFDYRAYNPATNTWRRVPPAPSTRGAVVWTGRELIGWGGGCCGDAFSDGSAYNPGANRWRRLPRSPLAGSQHPLMAWTGHEVVVVIGPTDADGKAIPARFARAAAYDPARNRWRRLAAPPANVAAGTAAYDGHEVLFAGGASASGAPASTTYALDPAANRWRRLASMPSGRTGAVATWTGTRLLLVGGVTGRSRTPATRGLAYDPRTNRWSVLPRAPLPARLVPTAAWTGRTLLVFGAAPTATWGHWAPSGAGFAPAA